MQKRNLLLLSATCGFLAFVTTKSLLTISTSPGIGRPKVAAVAQESSDEPDLRARIARIENGLLPPVIIKGEPNSGMTVADRMAFYKVPGVSVAFFDHGQIVWTRTYGFADLASKTPVTAETRFQAASISKPVSALAALRLVQDGKLSLDEDVNAKLHTWKVPENEFTKVQKVTLRRLLSHSAGLTVHGFPGYVVGEALPTLVQILNGEKPANTPAVRVDTVPGTLSRYSGGGYVVMQLFLTDITGEPFPQLVHDLVLQPAGMTYSTYEQPLPRSLSSSAATPYRSNGELVRAGSHTYPEMAPAGLWTTPSDLARLAIEVQKEYAGTSSKILSQAMMREMLTHQKGNSGLGFSLESPGHQPRFGHGGANEGFRCNLVGYMESGQGFAIMTNSDSGAAFGDEFLRAVAKEYNWPDFHPIERAQVAVDPKLFDGYLGRYWFTPDYIVTVTRDADHLFMQATGEPRFELFPASDRDYFLSVAEVTMTFRSDSRGRANELVHHFSGVDTAGKRVK